ncbi:PAS domain S-box-containing protein [Lachnospiraceae bacterium XPB1003]|nr:PAS domain S-box-containing protein [Lachnospiraceae bacterium XPB1003]
MAKMESRRERYSDGFALTKFTMPVIWQMSSVIPGGFFIYHEDEKRELIYANNKVLDIYGCKTLDEFKELTGYTFQGMVHPDDFESIQATIDSQIDDEKGDSTDHVEYRIIRKDGEVRWVDDYGHYSYSPEFGDVYYVFISDITEKKALIRSEKHYDRLYSDIQNLLADLDRIQMSSDEKTKADLEIIKKEMERITEVHGLAPGTTK